MPTVSITDADDPRLSDYRALNEPARRTRMEVGGGYFIVEGIIALERLLALALVDCGRCCCCPGWPTG